MSSDAGSTGGEISLVQWTGVVDWTRGLDPEGFKQERSFITSLDPHHLEFGLEIPVNLG